MKGKVGKNIVASFSYKEDKEPLIVELDVIAARERKHRSEIIVDLIEQYVKAHAAGNDTFKLDQWNEDPDFKAVPTILAHSTKWFSYLGDCSKDDLTDIAISAKNILRQIEHFRRK